MNDNSLNIISFFETYIHIKETNTKLEDRVLFNKLILLIHFFQILSFILVYNNDINSKRMKVLSNFFEYFSGISTFIEGNIETQKYYLLIFILMQTIFYLLLLYVILLTIIRIKKNKFYHRKEIFFSRLNRLINYFFIFYPWIFFIPVFSLCIKFSLCKNANTQLLFCNPQKSINYVFPLITSGFAIIFCLIKDTFNDNYSFLSKIPYRQKFGFFTIILAFLKILLIIVFHLNFSEKHLVLAVVIFHGLISSIDYCMNIPFRNKEFCIFYGFGCIFTFIFTLFLLIIQFQETKINVFYLFVLVIIFAHKISIKIYQFKINSLLMMNNHKPNIDYNSLIFYFELLIEYAEKAKKDEKIEFILTSILINHRKNCMQSYCLLKNQIDFEKIQKNFVFNKANLLELIKSWFQEKIHLKMKKNEKEIMFLKYNTFLVNECDNLVKAYVEIKGQMATEFKKFNKITFYFKILLEIIENRIKKQLINKNIKNMNVINADRSDITQFQYGNSFFKIDSVEKYFLKKFLKISERKIQFWNVAKAG